MLRIYEGSTSEGFWGPMLGSPGWGASGEEVLGACFAFKDF